MFVFRICCELKFWCLDGSVKDVTARYVSDWMTGARRRRVESGWWKESLLPFQTKRKVCSQSYVCMIAFLD